MDEQLRYLQRLARVGDIQAQAELLHRRVRAGELKASRVSLASLLGDPAARLVALPGEPHNVHCNYPPESIGFNVVDGTIGRLHHHGDLVTIGAAFIQHQLPPDCIEHSLITAIIERTLEIIAVDIAHLDTMDTLFELWRPNQSRSEFYDEHNIEAIKTRHGQIVRRIFASLTDLEHRIMSSEEPFQNQNIRWAAAYLLRMGLDKGRGPLSAVWAAVHCRLANRDGSVEAQQEELEWQRQYLIQYLLT